MGGCAAGGRATVDELAGWLPWIGIDDSVSSDHKLIGLGEAAEQEEEEEKQDAEQGEMQEAAAVAAVLGRAVPH